MKPPAPYKGITLGHLPPATWLIPLIGLVLLPGLASGETGTRLSFLFVELLFGIPLLVATPRQLKRLYLPMPRLERPQAFSAYGLALLAIPLFQLLSLGIGALLAPPPEVEAATRSWLVPDSISAALLTGITLIAVTPVCEELFFRGFLTRAWQEVMGSRGLLVGPALLFALAHMNPWQFPQLMALGLLLGALRLWSGSLGPPILLHLGVNLSSWLLLLSQS